MPVVTPSNPRQAKEAARDQAQKAEAEKANAEALKVAEAAARSKLEANKRCLGTVMKFSPKGFGIIQDAVRKATQPHARCGRTNDSS